MVVKITSSTVQTLASMKCLTMTNTLYQALYIFKLLFQKTKRAFAISGNVYKSIM